MSALEILISEIEHTAELADEDGSKVTASKLRAHLLQFAEATAKDRPARIWMVENVKLDPEATWIRISETQYVADEPWPKVGQRLEEVR